MGLLGHGFHLAFQTRLSFQFRMVGEQPSLTICAPIDGPLCLPDLFQAFIFPLGTLALCSLALGNELPSRFSRSSNRSEFPYFRLALVYRKSDIGQQIISVVVFVLFVIVSAGTIRAIIAGMLFHVPSTQDPSDREEESTSSKQSIRTPASNSNFNSHSCPSGEFAHGDDQQSA